MQVSYKVRPSQSPWPRVMRCVGRPSDRSVHRGKTRPCIELRKHHFVEADLVLTKGRQQRSRTTKASPTSVPRSLRPRAWLETFLAEAGRSRKHPSWRTNHETPESGRLDQGGTLFVIIQGKSRMRSFRTCGSVRGVARKGYS